MMKRFVFLALLTFMFGVVTAQTMSDNDVLKLIKTEQEKGLSQQEIATELVKKGVTMEQLKRIKQRVESEKKGSFTKSYDDEEEIDRNRNKMKLELDAKKLEKELKFVEEDEDDEKGKEKSINVEEEAPVFGRNIFNNELLTFEPSVNIPTPTNYILGAGDDVIIDIWGASQLNINETISPDGSIFIDGAGLVHLAGLSVAQAEKRLKESLSDVYGGSQVALSLGKARSIQVQVMGEVVTPGTYTLSAFSTVFNALYSSGGINEIGTLRDIKVFRNGKEVAVIDVYDCILNGDNKSNVRLQDNDVISVGAYVAIAEVSGKVKRPMKYEVKENETLLDVISYAGGFTGDAYTENLNVTRKNGREYSMHTVSKAEAATFTLKDGDALEVQAMLDRYSNMVEVEGAVFYPGKFELGSKVKTVRQLVEMAGGVHEEAFLNRAVLQHRNFDNTIETEAVDLKGILAGTSPDVVLKNNDLLFVPANTAIQGEQYFNIEGEVNLPGKYRFAKNTTIEDLILQAGGLTRAASLMKIDVYRHVIDPAREEYNDEISKMMTFSLKDGFLVNGGENFTLEPFDYVVVRRAPSYTPMKSVKAEGCLMYSGAYVMSCHNYRMSDLVKNAGGFTKRAYIKGASLSRKMSDDERKQRELVMMNSRIQLLEEKMRDSDNEINVAVYDSLMNIKLNIDEVYTVAINLEEAVKNPGSQSDLVLRDGDVLNVPELSYTVRVSGEVRHPLTLNYEKGKNIKYYVKHAGGYTDRARKKGVYVIYMNGDVLNASKSSEKVVEPGCEIVVPRKSSNSGLTPVEMATIGTSTASIATMIVAIINLLK